MSSQIFGNEELKKAAKEAADILKKLGDAVIAESVRIAAAFKIAPAGQGNEKPKTKEELEKELVATYGSYDQRRKTLETKRKEYIDKIPDEYKSEYADDKKSFGLTEEKFNAISDSPKEMDKINKGIEQMTRAADNISKNFKPFRVVGIYL